MAEKQNNNLGFDAAQVAAQLQFEQLQELLEKKRMKKEEEDQRKAVQLAAAKEMQKQRQKELAAQAACPHMKERNGGPAVVGTRDANMVTIFMCQRCFKEWDANDIPNHLRPNPKEVGGPIPGWLG